jgi:urease accessory protein
MKTTSRLLVCSLAVSLWALAAPAWAHDETGLAGGFISGLKHPVLGFDHLLAMVAVGLWGAVLGRPLIAALPVIFPAFMVVGGLLGIAGAPMAPVEIGIALSVLLLGAAIAARFGAPVWLAGLLVGVFGLFHGYAHGQELPVAADPTAYGLGFVLATGALHGAGIGLGLLDRRRGGRQALQVLGALIALAGVYFLYQATLA